MFIGKVGEITSTIRCMKINGGREAARGTYNTCLAELGVS